MRLKLICKDCDGERRTGRWYWRRRCRGCEGRGTIFQTTDDGELPPYSHQRARCPKCFRYARGVLSKLHAAEYVAADGDRPERMRRTCSFCGYQWDEATLDSSGTPAADAPKPEYPPEPPPNELE